MGDPFTAYVPGEVIQVLKMTNVHPVFLGRSHGYRGSRPSAPGTRLNRGSPFIAYVPTEVTHVSRMTNVHPLFLKKSPEEVENDRSTP